MRVKVVQVVWIGAGQVAKRKMSLGRRDNCERADQEYSDR
jgi:hypothetical protein